jgi:hypothetical protein
MQLKPGLKLSSSASTAEFIVIRAPQEELVLTCAGSPLAAETLAPRAATEGPELLVGKRYGDVAGNLELLCTAGGVGPLLLADEPLAMRAAKSLPSSD